jgi:hypothetical protein
MGYIALLALIIETDDLLAGTQEPLLTFVISSEARNISGRVVQVFRFLSRRANIALFRCAFPGGSKNSKG